MAGRGVALAALGVVTMLVAGCFGQSLSVVSYSGSGAGSSQGRVRCSGDSADSVDVRVEHDARGGFTVMVMDGEEKTVWSRAVPAGDGTVEETLSGAAGTWSLEVTRRSDFDGEYRVRMEC